MYISKKVLILLSGIFILIFGTVYAVNSISSITEVVSEGDIITADYYNNLNGAKSDGKYCQYVDGKLMCNDDLSEIYDLIEILNEKIGDTDAEILVKKPIQFSGLADAAVNNWNELVQYAIDSDPDYFKGMGFDDSCLIPHGEYVVPFAQNNNGSIDYCASWICETRGYNQSVIEAVHCGNGNDIYCPKANFHIYCIY